MTCRSSVLFLCDLLLKESLIFDFRLAFFELTFRFCTTQQLQWEVIRHYSKQVTHIHTCTRTKAKIIKCFQIEFIFKFLKVLLNNMNKDQILATIELTSFYLCLFQAIKQMYVLVLGLDVLGNPFGLIRGLSEGVEAFFYEPYQVGM